MDVLGQFVGHYGYIGVFFILVLGVVGLPLPDEVMLTYVGFSVFSGNLALFPSIIVAFLGSMIGISISYLIGRKLGLPFLNRIGPKIGIQHNHIMKVHNDFEKRGPLYLIGGFFIPGVRHVTAYIAGISSLRMKSFALFAYIGSLIWVTTFILMGNELGRNWTIVESYVAKGSKLVWLLVIFGIIIVVVFHKRKRNT